MTLLDHVETNQSRSFIDQADRAYAEGDMAQAVENAWKATSLLVKAIAERRGWKSDTPADMLAVMDRISEETDDQPDDLDILFQVAFILPYNFDEGWLSARDIENDIQDVKELLAMLEDIE